MKKMLKLSLVNIGMFLLFVNFALAAGTFNNPSSGLSTSQYYQPSFNNFYSSDQINTYWPILNDMKNGQCQASNDFLVAIPPLGCTPTVVRSDLLEEQNVPVFCQLDALQVNPLIKVSSIESINFKGDYPSEVAGISFHPARAAVNTKEDLLGSPILNNIGYVVIILKRTPAEKDMPDTVKGNLTATIRYDAEEAFGVGKAEFLLPLISDQDWEREFESYGFWNGRGFVRLLSLDGDNAEIGLYTDDNRLLQKVSLKKGETSKEIYFPGFYCKAGLEVRLNSLDAAAEKVKLSIDGEEVWAKAGTTFLNGKCQVKKIYPMADGTGTASIYCSGNSQFDLTLARRGAVFDDKTILVGNLVEKDKTNPSAGWYLGYIGELPIKVDNKTGNTQRSFAVLYNSTKELDSTLLARIVSTINQLGTSDKQLSYAEFVEQLKNRIGKEGVSKVVSVDEENFKGVAVGLEEKEYGADIESNFSAAKEALNTLLENNYYNEKDLAGNYYGEKALWIYADNAKSLDKLENRTAALELIVEKYPGSSSVGKAKSELKLIKQYDTSKAGKGVFVNNKYYYIYAEDFKTVTSDEKNVDLSIGKTLLVEGDEVCLDGNKKNDSINCSYVKINKIDLEKVSLSFSDWNAGRKVYSSAQPVVLYADSLDEKNSAVLGGRTVYVRNINVKEEVSVSILPKVDNTKTEANFTFNVGIEKRAIELSPAKTEEMIRNLNKSIADWESRVDKLGKLVTAWKGACLATSMFMMMSNLATGMGGESIARKNVMGEYKLICDDAISNNEFTTRTECYNAKSTEIDAAIKTGTANIKNYTNQLKDLETQAKTDGKNINQTELKRLMDSKLGIDSEKAKYMTTEQMKEYLFWKDISANSKDASLQAQADTKISILEKTAKDVGDNQKAADSGIIDFSNPAGEVSVTGYVPSKDISEKLINDPSKQKIQEVRGSDKKQYIIVLEKVEGNSERYETIGIYDKTNLDKDLRGSYTEATGNDLTQSNLAVKKIEETIFVESSCSYTYKNAKVKYYTVGVDKYLPSIVPFDSKKGWYVKSSEGGGGVFDTNVNSYQASGAPTYFLICNVGPNGMEENGAGDDICQSFNQNTQVDKFGGCNGLTSNDVNSLKNRAIDAIQKASSQYGKPKVTIGKEEFNSMLTSLDSDVECQDFMSIGECKTLFNVCDPVICPPSRCNLGGKYPVANVIQSGIIGSLLLCLPNAKQGVIVPVCLTGVHAGLESYLSILRSEKACLQENLESGKSVGICDEITSVYKCEFFWNQIAPIASNLLPKMVDMAYGNNAAASGGAEYLSTKAAWDNMQGSIDYFKNSYAQNSFNAFKFKNIQEVGSEFCRANIGTSVPGGADLVDGLLAPESPYQFYANFDESTFTEATVPSTSQYKVYYHIFAGNDQGASYSVYLQNPPDSAYYHQNPYLSVKTGYVAKGSEVDEAIDFTAPAGYKELCVMINAKTECGFKSVSTSMAVNYLRDKYVADQANESDIKTEKACISGTPSILAFATTPNIQAGAEGAINPDVSLRGIVRVCATENPGKGTNPDRWKDIGTCGNDKLKCWLDSESVDETVSKVNAVENSLLDSSKATENLAQKTKQTYAQTSSELYDLEKQIGAWKTGDDMTNITKTISTLKKLSESGASNPQMANVLYLEVSFHVKVVNSIFKPESVVSVPYVPTKNTENPVEPTEETLEINKPDYVLVDPKLTIDGNAIRNGDEVPKDSVLEIGIDKKSCNALELNIVTDRKWDLIFNKKQTITGQTVDLSSLVTIDDKIGKTSWISVRCMVNNKAMGKEVKSVEFKIVDKKTTIEVVDSEKVE